MRVKVENGKNRLIEVDEIRHLLKLNDDNLTLVFESGKTDDAYRKSLQNELTEYHVFNLRWMPKFYISPSIETDKILDRTEEIYDAAKSFRNDGIRLMTILGETYGVNTFEDGLAVIRNKSWDNKQRGKANEEWDFWFHGAECQFKNNKTGQTVELVITNCPEFGALDSYFFLRYVETTPRFKKLADFFAGDSNAMTKALNLLEDMGKLHRIDNNSQRGIFAK